MTGMSVCQDIHVDRRQLRQAL